MTMRISMITIIVLINMFKLMLFYTIKKNIFIVVNHSVDC